MSLTNEPEHHFILHGDIRKQFIPVLIRPGIDIIAILL